MIAARPAASLLCENHLSGTQRTDIAQLQKQFADVFSLLQGRTNIIEHRIEMPPGVAVQSRPYRLPKHKRKVVQRELAAMLEMGVIEDPTVPGVATMLWWSRRMGLSGSAWTIAG